jgi:hypothetical protein
LKPSHHLSFSIKMPFSNRTPSLFNNLNFSF